MLFSTFGEIGLFIIGLLYVLDCYVDSFINLAEITKNNENNEELKKLPESLKHIYS